MGFSTFLDILGSMFIGGILMLSLFQVNTNVITNLGYYTSDFGLQVGLLDLVQVIENDLKRTGYSKTVGEIKFTKDAIIEADSASIKIVGDVDADSTLDTVRYYVGPTSEMSNTTNPRDRILYRRINNQTPFLLATGITVFDLMYFDSFNDTLTTPIPRAETGSVVSIQVSLRVESPDAYNNTYADVYWRQIRLAARNLNNR